MSLASRIHGHFHPVDGEHTQEAAPFWVRHYDRVASVIAFGRVDRVHEGTLELAGFGPGLALLDIGCGTGELVVRAESAVDGNGTFVGLDSEPGMIAQAKRKALDRSASVTFEEASIDAIPYPDATFDVVTSSLMFHHLDDAQQRDGLTEILRVLSPGGTLLIVDINTAKRSVISRLPGHRTADTTDRVSGEVAESLREAGFESVSAGTHPFDALSYATGIKP